MVRASCAAASVILRSQPSFLRAFNDLMRRNFTFLPWCCSGLSTRTECRTVRRAGSGLTPAMLGQEAPGLVTTSMLGFWLCVGMENESVYDSCDNRGTGGARKRAECSYSWW